MGFGLFVPRRRMVMERDGNYANQEKLNMDDLRRGENQCKYQYKNRKKKKIRTHIVIREQLKSLLVFPK